jgi:transcriptional regulator PpsR
MNYSLQNAQHTDVGRFGSPELFLSDLDPQTAASLITASADVVLIMDEGGVIRDAAFGSEELLSHGYQSWLGKTWAQTVTVESRPKAEAMLKDLGNGKGAKWRHLNHSALDGSELPLSYSIVAVPQPKERKGGAHALAFGRDLRPQVALQQKLLSAQASMERDYWRLRHVETRYRLLFQLTSEALLILDGSTEALEEGNPSAHSLFGDQIARAGWSLSESLDQASYTALRQTFASLRSTGRASPTKVRLASNGVEMALSVSLFRQEETSHFLLRFTPLSGPGQQADKVNAHQMLAEIMESAPDALVVTDLSGSILTANQAFLQLAQVSNADLVVGESLERWLGRAGVDLSVLISNLRQRDVVRLFATRIKGEYGSMTEVEISAVAVTTSEQRCLGFTIRDVGLRLAGEAKAPKELPRSTGEMTELVGRVPLKDIVRETTDMIEQLCIEAALELTGDNRASAAEMLGLSRQSLYVKLRRFGIGELTSDAEG